MKTLKPILIVFSLLISLPFISKAQKVDSTISQVKFNGSRKIYAMRGIMISDSDLVKCLQMFPSSSLQYKKTHGGLKLHGQVFWGLYTSNVLLFISMTCYSGGNEIFGYGRSAAFDIVNVLSGIAVIAPFLYNPIYRHYHLHKAIRLYNKEILKRNK
jgi:hypothetical protein